MLIPSEDRLNLFELELHTGTFLHVSTDLFLPARPSIAFTRATRPLDDWAKEHDFFILHLYDVFNLGDNHPYTHQEIFTPDYNRYRFERISLGTGYRDALYRQEATRTVLYGSEIRWNGNGWDLRRLGNGFQLVFPDSHRAARPLQAAIVGLQDSSGNFLRLLRGPEHNLVKVVSQDGQWLELHREGDHITEVKDNWGNSVQYSYDGLGRLQSVAMPDATTLSYSYDGSNRITAVHIDGQLFLRNKYDDAGRVANQAFADGKIYCFLYSLDSQRKPVETTITDSHGRAITVRFQGRIYEISESLTSNRCK